MPRRPPSHTDLTIVIPIFNEADSLPHFLPDLIETCKTKKWQVIVVNDGSKDNSANVLSEYEGTPFVKIVHHKVNRGYGGALKTGLALVKTPYVVTIDGDGQHQV